MLRVLEAERVRASFLVDPVAAEQHQPLTASLTTRGDVGILSDPQTDYPAAKATLERIIQTNVRGTLTRDAHEQTLRSLFAAGFDYFLTDSISDRSVPQTIIRNNKPIIMLTKTVRDDDDVINRFGLKDSAFQLYTYKEGVERVAFQGGLYILRVHSHLQCKSENIAVVRELVRYMRKQRFWLATARDVSEWWLVRNALEVDAKERSNRRIALVVSNPTSYTIKNACLEVGINKKVTNIEISSDILGTKLPLFKYDQKRQIIEITIPELEGGNSFSYFIDYDNMPI